MQAIRDIHELNISIWEKYDKIVNILPQLLDNDLFRSEYIRRKSLDKAICFTGFAKEYFSGYDLEHLIEIATIYNEEVIYEVIYQKSTDKMSIYGLLKSKICNIPVCRVNISTRYARFEDLYCEFIRCAIRENNKAIYTEIIIMESIGYILSKQLRMLRFVIHMSYESNNKEFIRWFLEYTKCKTEEVLKSCITHHLEANVFLIRILTENSSVDDLVKYKLSPLSYIFQSFMLAGASIETLTGVYGNSQVFQEWLGKEDV